jgi:hypothetical protein
MSGISGPNLVTSGLVFAADAANMKSYLENSLSSSNDFSNATYWDKTSFPCIVTLNSTIAPDGTTTGNTVTGNGGVLSLIFQSIPIATSGTAAITASIYAKANTGTTFTLNVYYDGDTEVNTFFNLSTGTIAGGSGVITSVGNGWYRCSLNVPARVGSGTTVKFRIWPNPRADATNRSIDVWGAQVNHGTAAAPYTPTTATAVAKTLNDTSGNSVSGTCTDTTFSVTGGGSLTFNGSTSKISTTAVSGITGNGSWTMSMWANVDASENGAGRQGWLMWNFSSLTTNTLITMGVSGGSIEVAHYSNDFVYTSASVSFGSWSQYTVTYDGTTVSVYVNGIFKQSRSTGPFNIPATGTWFIGTSQAPGGATDFLRFNSGVTQVYNRALSATEVAQNFNATKIRYGL